MCLKYQGIVLRKREEIKRFTSALESLALPSSSTPAQGPDKLDRLIARVEQMYTMLDSYMQHTVD